MKITNTRKTSGLRSQANAASQLDGTRWIRVSKFCVHLCEIHGQTLAAEPERCSIGYPIGELG